MNTGQQKAIDCMAQHIKTFREQFLRGGKADFGEPCNECRYNRQCNYEWLEIMQPFLENSSVEIRMVSNDKYTDYQN